VNVKPAIVFAAFSKRMKKYDADFKVKHPNSMFTCAQSPGLVVLEYDSPNADAEIRKFYGKFGMGFALKSFEKIGVKFKIEKVEA
jgi:hypothetical protein